MAGMAEHWISAAKALEIAKDNIALCERLHAGMIQSRASVLIVGDRREQNCDVPKDFWWAQGHVALDQNWATGDFSTWLEGKQQLQAFGVTLGLSGVLELVSFEQRALITRRLSVAGHPDWISSREARRICYSEYGHNPISAGEAIIEQAKLGFIAARAVSAEGENYDPSNPPTWQEREWDVPTWFWRDFKVPLSDSSWVNGNFWGDGKGPNGIGRVTISGVHFYRDSLAALGGQKAASTSADGEKRGRKPTYDWIGATSAIWGKLNRGELMPDTQADIESALIDALKVGDKMPSESTVRPFARPIWEEFQKP